MKPLFLIKDKRNEEFRFQALNKRDASKDKKPTKTLRLREIVYGQELFMWFQ
jgi:hypothetical protein